ncbi:hypothetical protein EMIT0196P_10169 [Pseudomonas chlororaphis]
MALNGDRDVLQTNCGMVSSGDCPFIDRKNAPESLSVIAPGLPLRENARLFPIRFIQLDLDNPQEISDAKPS